MVVILPRVQRKVIRFADHKRCRDLCERYQRHSQIMMADCSGIHGVLRGCRMYKAGSPAAGAIRLP
jgi:hypothetical protein